MIDSKADMNPKNSFEAINKLSFTEVEDIINRNDSKELIYVPISVSLNSDDLTWAEEVCLRLSNHSDPIVRGNAVLGFGHLARRFREINLDRVLRIVNERLMDEEEYVRFQAADSLDDIRHFVLENPGHDEAAK